MPRNLKDFKTILKKASLLAILSCFHVAINIIIKITLAFQIDKERLLNSDCYLFGNTEIYCPFSVINYVRDLLSDRQLKPKNYWVNSSGNDIIKSFIINYAWNTEFLKLSWKELRC